MGESFERSTEPGVHDPSYAVEPLPSGQHWPNPPAEPVSGAGVTGSLPPAYGPPVYPPLGNPPLGAVHPGIGAARPGGFMALWTNPVVIAGVMGVILLLATALSIVAIRAVASEGGDDRLGADDAQTSAPTATGQTTAPASAPGTPSTAAARPTTSAVPGAGGAGVFLSGRMRLHKYGGEVDFDTAEHSYSVDKAKRDMSWSDTALKAENRAAVRSWTGPAEPTAAGCGEAGAKWQDSVHMSVLVKNAVLCFKTSDGRVGAFTVSAAEKDSSGQLSSVEFEYLVWKKDGDQ